MGLIILNLAFNTVNSPPSYAYDPNLKGRIVPGVNITINGLTKKEIETLGIRNNKPDPDPIREVDICSAVPRLMLDNSDENEDIPQSLDQHKIELWIDNSSLVNYGLVHLQFIVGGGGYRNILLGEALKETLKVLNKLDKIGYSVICQSSNALKGGPSSYIWTLKNKN